MYGVPTPETLAADPRLVALVGEVRAAVLRYTDPVAGQGVHAADAWLAVALITLGEVARHGVGYAVVTTMAYRAYRDHEERDAKPRRR